MLSTAMAVLIFWLTGTSLTSMGIARTLEMRYKPAGSLPKADAIVLLAGVTARAYAPQPVPHLENGADRLVYAASLFNEGKAPLIILSGNRFESAEMTEVLEMMGVPNTAIVPGNATLSSTYAGGIDSRRALVSNQVHCILLITSAIRMPRASAVFRRMGVAVIPAPTDYLTRSGSLDRPSDVLSTILPSLGGMELSMAVIHELAGLLAYRIAGWI